MVAAGGPTPRYEIVCSLAQGGMAELFLAKLTGPAGFERLVVVKRLAATLADEPAAMRALFDEARIGATLSHANIVQVHDVDLAGGQVSIVMELLHGFDVAKLQQRLARMGEPFPVDQAIAIALGVCAGLHHAHERRSSDGKPLDIVHRDVSPQNVFVTYDGSVKLVDFGIARATTRIDKTEQGVIKGKPGYMAPEQIRGQTIDRRTDVWASAVLLYQMTTGRMPHDGKAFEQFVAVTSREPCPPSDRVADYPAELEAIVLRGMARDPAARYPTAEAMARELDAFARKRGADQSPFRLAALMAHAFDAELAAWKQAEHEGRSLADRIDAMRGAHDVVGTALVPGEPVAPMVEPAIPELEARASPRRRPSLALLLVPLAFAAGFAIYFAISGSSSSTAKADPPAAASPPALAPVPPVPAPPPDPVGTPAVVPPVAPDPSPPDPPPAPPPTRSIPAHHHVHKRPPPTAPPPAPTAPTAPDHDAPLPH